MIIKGVNSDGQCLSRSLNTDASVTAVLVSSDTNVIGVQHRCSMNVISDIGIGTPMFPLTLHIPGKQHQTSFFQQSSDKFIHLFISYVKSKIPDSKISDICLFSIGKCNKIVLH
jgi:hypothetical protein